MRLNKYLALCGIASRRKSEELILEGKVKVNGSVVTKLAVMVDPDIDIVELNKKKIKPVAEFVYIILNKPMGYITTLSDEKNRVTVMELIPEKYRRVGVFPVGRLDKDTEGVLLLTNDGDLANKLTSPKSRIPKEYIVELDKPLLEKDKNKMKRGIFIHQLKLQTRPILISAINKSNTAIKVTLQEGKKRQIRYTFKKFGYTVNKLTRISFGPITTAKVNKGGHRVLKSGEINKLKKLTSTY